MAVATSPMTYAVLEELIGDMVLEPGSSAGLRYTQDKRQRAIIHAEVMALRHLSDDDCRNLIGRTGAATSASGKIEVANLIASGTDGDRFFDVIDIMNATRTGLAVHFKKVEQDKVKILDNLNYKYGYYWYYLGAGTLGTGNTREIQLKAAVDADYKAKGAIDIFVTFKIYPHSYSDYDVTAIVPFNRNEELIAKGAAGFLLTNNDDPRGQLLTQEFYAGLGLSAQEAA